MTNPLRETDRVRIDGVETLDNSWGTLSRYRLSYRRSDGRMQNQSRNVYDRGDAATILLRDPVRDVVLLTRQLRIPALVNGHVDGMLLEAPAGGLDGDKPADAVRREVEEETGYRIGAPRALFSAFMSPGSMTERVHFFMADYSPGQRVGAGGGLADEGEDIELIETPLTEALAMIDSGAIVDAKTIMLLQRAALERIAGQGIAARQE